MGILSSGQIQSDVTSQVRLFSSFASTQATSFTLGQLWHYYATQGTIGVGSAVTSQMGFLAENTLIGATNNFGFYSNIASGTGRFNFYAAGTAANYFAGNVGIATASPVQLLEVGSEATSNNYIQISAANNSTSGIKFRSDSSKATGYDIGYEGNGNYFFFSNDVSGTVTERLRITSAGGISFGSSGTAFGSSGQILMSNGDAPPTYVSAGNQTANVGYLNIPQNSQSAAYTLVLADSGKQIFHPSADTTARTWTIPANSSVAFPIGTAVTFINQNGAGVITIAITTDTMRLAGAGTTGSRTLAANGIATAIKITSTEWIISGTGLT
jgi:hypothetical protein